MEDHLKFWIPISLKFQIEVYYSVDRILILELLLGGKPFYFNSSTSVFCLLLKLEQPLKTDMKDCLRKILSISHNSNIFVNNLSLSKFCRKTEQIFSH